MSGQASLAPAFLKSEHIFSIPIEREYFTMDMKFDIKEKVEELAAKLQKDPALLENFQDSPVKTLEGLLGIDLPDDQLKPLVAGIKAKLAASDLGGKLDGLKKLF
jgi:hypothetical protein